MTTPQLPAEAYLHYEQSDAGKLCPIPSDTCVTVIHAVGEAYRIESRDSLLSALVPKRFITFTEEFMSLSINWEPRNQGGTIKNGSSTVWRALQSTFGGDTVILLDLHSMGKVRAMYAATKDDAYKHIVELIEQYGEIQLEKST